MPRNKELFLSINGIRVVSLNGPNSGARRILGSVTCNFGTDAFTIQNAAAVDESFDNIQTCYEFANNSLTTYTTSSNTFGSGFGQVYNDERNILYITSTSQPLIDFIEQQRINAPRVVEPVTVLVVERGDQLVLNIDNTNAENDNIAESTDDNLILTGSTCRNIARGQSILYNNEALNIFVGSTTTTISNIEECYVLIDVNGCVEFTRHSGSREGALSGPGLLCTGNNQLSMGQDICFFSEDATNQNSVIMRSLVEGQMTFQTGNPTGSVVGALGSNDGMTLFSVSTSTQTSTLPDAGRIEFSGGVIIVRDRFGNVLQQIGRSGSANSLTYFTGTTVRSFGSASTMTLNDTVSGLSIATTNSMVFAYPSGNTVIQSGISMLQNFIPTTPSTPVLYHVISSQFGTINLFANGQLVQEVSNSMSVEIGRTQCLVYLNNMLNIFENCDTASTPVNRFSNIEILSYDDTVADDIRTFTGNRPNPLQGPGRLYIDGTRSFLTSRPGLNTLIRNTNNAGARAGVSIVAATNAQGMTAASLVNGGVNLFTFDMFNTSIIPIESNEGLLYIGGNLGIANIIPVPEGATVQFIGGSAIIEGGPGPSMNVSIGGTARFVQNFPGSTTYTQADPSTRYPGGGILYIGNNGAVYNRDSRISSDLYNSANSVGAITDVIMQTNLTFNGGGIIRMFTNSAGMLLRGPGTLYSNTGERAFYTTDSTLINRIPSTVSQIVPFGVRYDSNTGDIVITTANSAPVSSISVDSERFRIPTGSMVTVNSGVITVTGGSGTSQIIAMDIDTITVFNGVSASTIMTTNTMNLPIPGSFYIDETQREAIYITERFFVSRVANTVNNAFLTFTPPIIPQPTVREVVTGEQTLNADFGQGVTVHEGSTVMLRCQAGSANPPAMFAFFQRDRNTQNFTSLEMAAIVRVTTGVNEATLEISSVALGSTEYRCDTSNLLGTATAFTRVTGLTGSKFVFVLFLFGLT